MAKVNGFDESVVRVANTDWHVEDTSASGVDDNSLTLGMERCVIRGTASLSLKWNGRRAWRREVATSPSAAVVVLRIPHCKLTGQRIWEFLPSGSDVCVQREVF